MSSSNQDAGGPPESIADSDELFVLLIDSSFDDAQRVEQELRKAGGAYRIAHVESREQLVAALKHRSWDVALYDGVLQDLSAKDSVAVIRSMGLDLPVVVVSNASGEQVAMDAMDAGAADYIRKGRIRLLANAVAREAHARRVRKHASDQEQRIMDQMEQALRVENLGQLAASVAHDVNTPLQYVAGNLDSIARGTGHLVQALRTIAEVCQRGLGTPDALLQIQRALSAPACVAAMEDIPSAIADSVEGVASISRVVKSLRDRTRKGPVSHSRIDIRRLVESVVRSARPEWEGQAEVTTSFDSRPADVTANEEDLGRALLNLVVNAAQAIAERTGRALAPGRIDITTEVHEQYVRISVADNGIGMPPHVKERIYEPYFTTKPVGKGTGQGLPFVYTTIVQTGGAVEVDTEPGVGTTFQLYLPTGELAAAVRHPSPPPTDSQRSTVELKASHVRPVENTGTTGPNSPRRGAK